MIVEKEGGNGLAIAQRKGSPPGGTAYAKRRRARTRPAARAARTPAISRPGMGGFALLGGVAPLGALPAVKPGTWPAFICAAVRLPSAPWKAVTQYEVPAAALAFE